MFQMFYSPSKGLWGSPLLPHTVRNILPDAVQVPADSYVQLCQAAAQGKDTAVQVNAGGIAVQVTGNPAKDMTLAQAQAQANTLLTAAYNEALGTPVSYTSAGGVTQAFQADPVSQTNMQSTLIANAKAATLPAGFYWVAADTTQVLFTYADVQGLSAAVYAQALQAFQHLQAKKALVNAATVAAGALAVLW